MKFRIEDRVAFPQGDVYRTQRDHLADLAVYLPDIESIVVESRREEGGKVHFVNLWKAAQQELPALARGFIKPEMLGWTDYATWNEADWSCEWRIQLGFLPEAIHASGRNTWLADGEGTRCIIEGEIRIDATKVPGVPRLMAGKIGDTIEKVVVKLIEPNLKKTTEGVVAYLKANR